MSSTLKAEQRMRRRKEWVLTLTGGVNILVEHQNIYAYANSGYMHAHAPIAHAMEPLTTDNGVFVKSRNFTTGIKMLAIEEATMRLCCLRCHWGKPSGLIVRKVHPEGRRWKLESRQGRCQFAIACLKRRLIWQCRPTRCFRSYTGRSLNL